MFGQYYRPATGFFRDKFAVADSLVNRSAPERAGFATFIYGEGELGGFGQTVVRRDIQHKRLHVRGSRLKSATVRVRRLRQLYLFRLLA